MWVYTWLALSEPILFYSNDLDKKGGKTINWFHTHINNVS
jgi:hypothetical protein